MSMKETHDTKISDSNSFRKEEGCLSFGGNEVYDMNGPGGGTGPVSFRVNGGDEHRKTKVLDEFSNENESGTVDSPRKRSSNGDLHCLDGRESAESLTSETMYEEKTRSSPELEFDEFMLGKIKESRKSGSVHITISDLFEMDDELYTEKRVLECDPPELSFFSKEANCHVVKDICIDEGMPANDKNSNKSSNDDGVEGGVGDEVVVAVSLGSYRSIDGSEEILLAQCRPKFAPKNSFDEDTSKSCDPDYSMQASEANRGATSKIVADACEEDSYVVDRELPSQDSGTPSFLTSLLDTLDDDGNKSRQPTVEAEPKEDDQQNTILYNSKVERGSITFDFTNGITDNVKEQSDESGNMHDGVTDNCTPDVREQDRDIKIDNLDKSSDNDDDHNSHGRKTNDEIQNPNDKDQSCKTDDGLAVELRAMKHERRSSDDVSVVGLLQRDDGDTSFSAAGLISFSGPVAYSGSLSLRSEGSATSGRSFAFPVLQSEWNTSPVRMAKADRRAFRKHKGWRSGLLCCRF